MKSGEICSMTCGGHSKSGVTIDMLTTLYRHSNPHNAICRYWDPEMSGVDWETVLQRYLPLSERVSSRSELGDVMREMASELGVSHCYEDGGMP